jgi:hypothetical protein
MSLFIDSFFCAHSTMDEIEAMVECGFDAMFEVYENGGDPNVAFFKGEVPKNEDNNANDNKNNNADEMGVDNAASGEVLDEEEVCVECWENPCVFFLHEELLVAFDEAEHGERLEGEDVPPNNVRRKKLYRQLTLMLNGGPMGAGVRRPLPSCCVSAIRDMLPSDSFMGFKAE